MLVDTIKHLRAMANSPVYAVRRGILLVAAQNLEAFQSESKAKDKDIERLIAGIGKVNDEGVKIRRENKQLKEVLGGLRENFGEYDGIHDCSGKSCPVCLITKTLKEQSNV